MKQFYRYFNRRISFVVIGIGMACSFSYASASGASESKAGIYENAAFASTETDFIDFSFARQAKAAIIDNVNHTILVEVANTADVTSLIANFKLSAGASATINGVEQQSGVTANNFTSPVTYTVTAEDGLTTQSWTVTVTKSLNTFYAENFNNCSGTSTSWTVYSVASDKDWGCTTFGRNGTSAMQMSGNSANSNNEDWLISPAFDLDKQANERLRFWARTKYSGDPIKVLYSTNYAGTGDPTSATWKEVPAIMLPAENSDVWQEVVGDLNPVVGTSVYVAFKYTATADKAPRWTIDDVSLEVDPDGIFEVKDIASLRKGAINSTVYQLTTEAVLTFKQTNRNQKFIQDATAGILIDDSGAKITTNYNVGDGITGLRGKLSTFNNMVQFVPAADPGAATSTANTVVPIELTINEFNANFEEYESRLVKFKNVRFANLSSFENGKVYTLSDGTSNASFRTSFSNVDYIGTQVPLDPLNVVGIANSTTSGSYITARNKADIEILGPNQPVKVSFLTEDFSGCPNSPQGWTIFSVSGDKNWECVPHGRNSTDGLQINGYKGNGDSNDWLISPSINLDEYTNRVLNFWTRTVFNGSAIEVLYSTDYTGSGDPTTATWAAVPNVTLPAENSNVWTEVTADISSITGTSVYIAFKYTGTPDLAARWTLDDIVFSGETTSTVPFVIADASGMNSDFGNQAQASASASRSYKVAGFDLTEDLLIVAPKGFGISLDNINFKSELRLTPVNNKIDATVVYVRFQPSTTGVFSGEIVHSSGVSSAKVKVNGTGVNPGLAILAQDFNECSTSLNGWTSYSVSSDKNWECVTKYGRNSTNALQISGYKGNENSNDWLISPALNLNATDNELFSFYTRTAYNGDALQVLYSTNYAGSGDPSAATWTAVPNITLPAENSDVWTAVTADISSISGTSVYFAFKYTSTPTLAARWTLDDIAINIESPVLSFSNTEIQIDENTGVATILTVQTSKAVNTDQVVEIQVTNGEGVAYGVSGDYSTSPEVTGSVIRLTIPANSTEASITLHIHDDEMSELNEVINFKLAYMLTSGFAISAQNNLEVVIRDNEYSEIKIADIRSNTIYGTSKYDNQRVIVGGVVHGANTYHGENSNAWEYHIFDKSLTSKRGLPIRYDGRTRFSADFKESDSVAVNGRVLNDNGLTYISVDEVNVIAENKALVTPVAIAGPLTEAAESDLVTLKNVRVVSGWNIKVGQSLNMVVANENGDEYKVVVLDPSGLSAYNPELTMFTLTGFGYQKDETAPYENGYYIVMASSDNKNTSVLTAIQDDPLNTHVLAYPNPATTRVYFKGVNENVAVRIIDAQGKVVAKQLIQNNSLDVSQLVEGLYVLQIQDNKQVINQRLIIKR